MPFNVTIDGAVEDAADVGALFFGVVLECVCDGFLDAMSGVGSTRITIGIGSTKSNLHVTYCISDTPRRNKSTAISTPRIIIGISILFTLRLTDVRGSSRALLDAWTIGSTSITSCIMAIPKNIIV